MIKSRRMRWTGHVASMGETRNAYKVLAEKSEVRDSFGDLGIYGRKILQQK
jgi:hypothetical protein